MNVRKRRRINNIAARCEYYVFTGTISGDFTIGFKFVVKDFDLRLKDLLVTKGASSGVNKVSVWEDDGTLIHTKSGIQYEETPKVDKDFYSKRVMDEVILEKGETYRIGVFCPNGSTVVFYGSSATLSVDPRYLDFISGVYANGDAFPASGMTVGFFGFPNFNFQPIGD